MSLFDSLGGRQQINPQQQILQRLRQDPAGTLRQKGVSIPDGMRDPGQILRYLQQTRQLNQMQQAMLTRAGFR